MSLHRRDFIKMLGVGASLPMLNHIPSFARAQPQVTEDELVAQIRATLEALFEGHEMALDFRRIDDKGNENFRITIRENHLYPVASAFKAWLVLMYFIRTPKDEWNYAADSMVYRTAVFSNNGETGRLLYEMGQRVEGEGNAIVKFNNFIMETLGLKHGLFSWAWPNTPTVGMLDERFRPNRDRYVRLGEKLAEVGNISTADDLAKGYQFIIDAEKHPLWESDPQFPEAIRITRELLAIPAPEYRSPIEMVLSSGYIGKDGTLPMGDLPEVGRVINDAGIIRVPNGQYILSFMSSTENESVTQPTLQTIIDSMRQYEAAFFPSGVTYTSGKSSPVYKGRYNYGFVRHQKIDLYAAPDRNAEPIDNPVRRNTIFGLMYLMQGALVRFIPLDSEWGVIIRDDEIDNTFSRDDWTFGFAEANWVANRPDYVYVRLEDLLVITHEHARALGYVTDAPDGTDKYIIMDVPRRMITLYEGVTPVLKTPIVLNMEQTPRGHLYVHRKYVTRNMPNYPSVPYASFLHDGSDLHLIGYAIHGSPWHRWSETITRRETLRRYSKVCINLPNWSMKIGQYNMPVDEFVFRWMGGYPAPGRDRLYLPQNVIIRVFSATDIYKDLIKFPAPESVRATGYNWGDILDGWDAKSIDAPESYFEPTLL